MAECIAVTMKKKQLPLYIPQFFLDMLEINK